MEINLGIFWLNGSEVQSQKKLAKIMIPLPQACKQLSNTIIWPVKYWQIFLYPLKKSFEDNIRVLHRLNL